MPTRYSAEQLIKNAGYNIGFSEVGIADITPSARSRTTFDRWIKQGKHGDMRYLSGGSDKRHDPSLLLDDAKSAICVAVNYYSQESRNKNGWREQNGQGVFSNYAYDRDYHLVLKEMLDELAGRLRDFFPGIKTRACVDTQPISERDLAIKSGIAWLGKNTCVISQEYGSWIFLGELLTNLQLESDQPLESLCGSCTRCMDACPTDALHEAYVLDATKCISYLTIEKRGDIAAEFHEQIGNNIFGCDECQRVCPFNSAARETQIFTHDFCSPLLEMTLEDLQEVSDVEFLAHTRDSAIRRCKADGIRRNAGIVLQNLRSQDT
ncbi:MAG: tRNA epoxyqueuosine(34) reductase QueG [Candidatus Krumholzibacteria bacterium]|nr:tRNA epoxyqueuosine(34) reductase QueG [Candidatus Krumholzibacteria bacterium]